MHDLKALRRVLEYAAEKLEQKGQPTGWPDEIERRKAPRFDYSAEGTGTLVDREAMVPIDIEPDFPIITLSLSRGGTGFLANYDLQPGDMVELVLPSAGGATKKLRARVVRTKRAGLNAYDIGAEFVHEQQEP